MISEFSLQRFVDAQDLVYTQVRGELSAGQKTSHWMWFIFPQIRGLGRSALAERFGIGSIAEATAYLRHPVLGARLKECTQLVLAVEGRTAAQIFGSPDDVKFRSSMTLFAALTDEPLFKRAIDKYFAGVEDSRTVALLERSD